MPGREQVQRVAEWLLASGWQELTTPEEARWSPRRRFCKGNAEHCTAGPRTCNFYHYVEKGTSDFRQLKTGDFEAVTAEAARR